MRFFDKLSPVLHLLAAHEDMKSLRDLIAHWQGLKTWDLIIIVWIFSIIFGILLVIYLFKRFIDSKPSGRKTVLGNPKFVFLIKYLVRTSNFSFD